MKKTLCKTIHEADRTLFICIEDIVKILSQNGTIYIYCINDNAKIIEYKTREEAKEVCEKIIKELEEYYVV